MRIGEKLRYTASIVQIDLGLWTTKHDQMSWESKEELESSFGWKLGGNVIFFRLKRKHKQAPCTGHGGRNRSGREEHV